MSDKVTLAFPVSALVYNYDDGAPDTIIHDGMTLRDYFAAKAMPICYEYWMKDFFHPDYLDAVDRNSEGRSDFTAYSKELIAEDAYLLADAMMKAREQ